MCDIIFNYIFTTLTLLANEPHMNSLPTNNQSTLSRHEANQSISNTKLKRVDRNYLKVKSMTSSAPLP